MAVNFDINSQIDLSSKPAKTEEVIEENSDPQVEIEITKQQAKLQAAAKDVKLVGNYKTKQAITCKRRRRRKKKTDDEARERAAQNGKVRKYTKEMQNREAIIEKSMSMRREALQTESNMDDKFAFDALMPTRRFDKIIYGSATADDAEDMLEDIFDDIVEASDAADID